VRPKQYIESAQGVTASSLAGMDVHVVYDAKDAPYADLKNRVMHLRPTPDELSSIDLEDLRGDCDHESGHFKHTDITALEDIKCPFLKLLINVVEDGRIEKLITDEYYGCGENLANSGGRAIDRIRESRDSSEESKRRRALAGVTLLTFGHERSKVLRMVGEDVDELFDEIDDIIPTLKGLPTTYEVVTKSKELKERWSHWAKSDTKSPKKKSADCKKVRTNSEKDTPKKGKKGKKPSASPEKPEGEKDKSSSEGDAGKPDESEISEDKDLSSTSEDKAPSESESDPTKKEFRKLAKLLKDSAIADVRKSIVSDKKFTSRDFYLADTDQDVVRVIDSNSVRWRDREEFLHSVKATVPVLRRKTLMEFQGVGRKVVRHKKKGKIDGRSLFKVAFGSNRVFKNRTPAIVVNAFVSLLVDCSSSMYVRTGAYKNIYLAAQCAAAMSQTLDLINVDHECLGFTTRDYFSGDIYSKHKSMGGAYDRVRPLLHLVVKQVREGYNQSRDRFVALGKMNYADQNVDGEGLLWAAHRVLSQAAVGAKPIIIMFSDGVPASTPETCSVLDSHLKRSVERVEKAGVSVIGVGMGTDHVKNYFANYVVVSKIEDMAEQFFVLLRKVLRETSIFYR